MKHSVFLCLILVLTELPYTGTVLAEDRPVGITRDMPSVTVKHQGKAVKIEREQDNTATVEGAFALTSRPCPPFCIQPVRLAPGVETLGELEVLDYLRQASGGDNTVLVIDSRTPDWVKRGTIPGSVNIPWSRLNPAQGASPLEIADIMSEQFGCKEQEGLWNFSNARTLVMFCNGMWCGQSPNSIANLLKFGYPADKLKWYRGGMQNWRNLGLTVVMP